MIWTEGTHQSAKFQTFDCSREILLKVYEISAKTYRGIMYHDTEERRKNF